MNRKYIRWNPGLKNKIILNILVVLIPTFSVIGLLFFFTNSQMKEKHREMVRVNTRNIVEHIDELLLKYYNISDTLASDDNLLPYMEKEYGSQDHIIKEKDTLSIQRLIFARYDLLLKKEKMSAVFTYKGELFNFEDIYNDGKEVKNLIYEMNVMDEDKLAKFWWYPVRENFLNDKGSEEQRNNKVIYGSRKIYNSLKSGYICSHIFAMKEEQIYRNYAEFAGQLQGDVYVIMEDGSLLSTNADRVLDTGNLPPEIKEVVCNRTSNDFEWKNENETYRVYIGESAVSDWLTVVIIPVKNVTRSVDELFGNIILIMAACMLACVYMVFNLYKKFMEPISLLSQSMKEVYNGNLNAYIEEAKEKEIGSMMRYYNSMLKSINTYMDEKLKVERTKNRLELEVLMSQVNPHFLYNTLENIVWMSNEAGYPEIGRLSASLGRMYRLSLSGGQIIVRMQQEVEHLMSYINIQKNRYGDQFTFELRSNIEEIRQMYTLKLILQPVVENSFIHGKGKLEKAIHIRVAIRNRDGYTIIKIADNGAGMDRERLKKVRLQIKEGKKRSGNDYNQKSSGIGLYSVEARIRLYFGSEDPVTLYSKKGMGTVTVIRVPHITEEDFQSINNSTKDAD